MATGSVSGSASGVSGYYLAPSDVIIAGVQTTGVGSYTQGCSYFHTVPGSALVSAARCKIPLAAGNVSEVWTCGIWDASGTLQDSIALTITGARAVWRFGAGYLAPPRTLFTIGWWRTDNAGSTWAGTAPTGYKTPLLAARGSSGLPVLVAPNLWLNEPSMYASGQATKPVTFDTSTTLRSGDVEIASLTGTLLP